MKSHVGAKPSRKTSSLCHNNSKPTAQHKTALLHVSHMEIRQCFKNSLPLPHVKVFQKQCNYEVQYFLLSNAKQIKQAFRYEK